MSITKIKQMLHDEGHLDAVKLIELLEGSINQKAEFLYLKAYVRESDFDTELSRDQLRCLWTGYCFHHELTVDTAEYDNSLLELWADVNKSAPAVVVGTNWSSFDAFDQFMCEYLV